MLIPFHGQITERDLTPMFALALKGKRWMSYVFGPITLIFFAASYMVREHATFYVFLMPVIIFGFLASYPFWAPLASANAAYKRQAEMRGTFEGTISEEEILLRTVNFTENIKWPVWKKAVWNKEFVLLFQSSGCFNFFPRSFFASEEDWQNFQTLLDEKIKSGALK